jgi:hypothetical protein
VHKENEGTTRAAMDGCALAIAPWVARQDADDLSLPGRLRVLLDRARQPDAPVLVGCGSRTVTDEGDLLDTHSPPIDSEEAQAYILKHGRAISPHGSILFSRAAYEKVGGYRAPFYYAQDLDLTTRLAEVGSVAAVEGVYYEYRFSASAISGSYGRYQREFYKLIRQGHELRRAGVDENPLLEQVESVRQQCLEARKNKKNDPFEPLYFIGACLRYSNPKRARVYFWRALTVRSRSLKAWVRLLQTFVCQKGS